jgi:hypothetical protein
LLEHVLEGGLGHEERAGEVDGEDLVPVLVFELEGELVGGDAGVVDEDVEAAVAVDDLLDGLSAIVGGGDVALVDRAGGALGLEVA